MNPLSELKNLVTPKGGSVDKAVVVEVSPTSITVRTRHGLRVVSPAGVNNYRVGESVRIQNDVLLGRGSSDEGLPVFRV